jgi:hypothetical protein
MKGHRLVLQNRSGNNITMTSPAKLNLGHMTLDRFDFPYEKLIKKNFKYSRRSYNVPLMLAELLE